jgi:hypothetical protein
LLSEQRRASRQQPERAGALGARLLTTLEGAGMRGRQVVLRRGRHIGWWVEGRWASGRLFMKTWWPTQGLARVVARFVGGRADAGGGAEAVDSDAS